MRSMWTSLPLKDGTTQPHRSTPAPGEWKTGRHHRQRWTSRSKQSKYYLICCTLPQVYRTWRKTCQGISVTLAWYVLSHRPVTSCISAILSRRNMFLRIHSLAELFTHSCVHELERESNAPIHVITCSLIWLRVLFHAATITHI